MPSFQLDLARFAKTTQVSLLDIVRKIVIEVFSGVVVRTPVDTGRARANWLPSLGVPAGGFDWDMKDKTCQITIGKITAFALASAGADGHMWLTNNLPYIKGLEEGWSWRQAPMGMARITVEAYGAFLASIGTPIRP